VRFLDGGMLTDDVNIGDSLPVTPPVPLSPSPSPRSFSFPCSASLSLSPSPK
jgi:hypothetical protein